MRLFTSILIAAGSIGAAFSACDGDTAAVRGPASTDAGAAETAAADVTADTQKAPDGAPSDSTSPVDVADAGPTYSSLSDPKAWSFFDIHDPTNFGPAVNMFQGATFDGRYVYFAPAQGTGIGEVNSVLRYDPQGTFEAKSSWQPFDLRTLGLTDGGTATSFTGAIYDGNYVYFVPFNTHVVRHDHAGDFADAAAWQVLNLAANIGTKVQGFQAGGFDGRYVYLSPYGNGIATRFDTQLAIDAGWGLHDLAANTTRYAASAFDGHYVYFAPVDDTSSGPSGRVARFDSSQADFGASWVSFDTATLPNSPRGFLGAVYDGKYIYFVPYRSDGLVARYDTTQPFADANSWTSFAITSVPGAATMSGGTAFAGGNFDGRYVYFVPYGGGGTKGIVVRYDTTGKGFGALEAWEAFDIASLKTGAVGFQGCTFDGKNLYLVPYGSGIAARFAARSPALPPNHASFF
jgi:hypothetical protein